MDSPVRWEYREGKPTYTLMLRRSIEVCIRFLERMRRAQAAYSARRDRLQISTWTRCWARSNQESLQTSFCSTPTRWDDIHNVEKVHAVVLNGRYLTRDDLEKML